MSAKAGWYPDPGGGDGLYRYWDGKAWSAATSPHPNAAPPSLGLVNPGASGTQPTQPTSGQAYGSQSFGGQPYGTQPYGSGQPYGSQSSSGQSSGGQSSGGQYGGGQYQTPVAPGAAYAAYQQRQQRRSPWGWWLAGGALVVVILVIVVLAVRATTGAGTAAGTPGGQGTQNLCPEPKEQTAAPGFDPNDGRVHGGPVSYPLLGDPWSEPTDDDRVPFGTDTHVQSVVDQENYDGKNHSWVASVLVAELQAGDGFFTPQDGSKIVVKCILGTFYGDAAVTSDVIVDKAATIDGHDAWIVESKLHFDIPGLTAKGERLIVAIVSAGARSGLYYASIPDTQPQLLSPAREALRELTVDG